MPEIRQGLGWALIRTLKLDKGLLPTVILNAIAEEWDKTQYVTVGVRARSNVPCSDSGGQSASKALSKSISFEPEAKGLDASEFEPKELIESPKESSETKEGDCGCGCQGKEGEAQEPGEEIRNPGEFPGEGIFVTSGSSCCQLVQDERSPYVIVAKTSSSLSASVAVAGAKLTISGTAERTVEPRVSAHAENCPRSCSEDTMDVTVGVTWKGSIKLSGSIPLEVFMGVRQDMDFGPLLGANQGTRRVAGTGFDVTNFIDFDFEVSFEDGDSERFRFTCSAVENLAPQPTNPSSSTGSPPVEGASGVPQTATRRGCRQRVVLSQVIANSQSFNTNHDLNITVRVNAGPTLTFQGRFKANGELDFKPTNVELLNELVPGRCGQPVPFIYAVSSITEVAPDGTTRTGSGYRERPRTCGSEKKTDIVGVNARVGSGTDALLLQIRFTTEYGCE